MLRKEDKLLWRDLEIRNWGFVKCSIG